MQNWLEGVVCRQECRDNWYAVQQVNAGEVNTNIINVIVCL